MKKILGLLIIVFIAFNYGCGLLVGRLQPIPDDAEIIFSARWGSKNMQKSFGPSRLYVMDSGKNNIVRITNRGKYYNHFAVSPNRKMIAAIRFTYGDTNLNGEIDWADRKVLWIMDLENNTERALFPSLNAGWGGVDWSPDSNYVYLSILKNGISDIYRVRVDGSEIINITEDLQRNIGEPETGKWVSDVSISFDGEWLACLYREKPSLSKAPSKDSPNIIVMFRNDGSEAKKVTDGGELIEGNFDLWGRGDFDPEFSPDGQRIVFQRATNAGLNYGWMPSHDINTIKIDGTGLKKLSPDGNTGVHGIADWSLDNRIIFSEWNEADNYIGPVMVNADGTDYRRLTGVAGATYVRWISPVNK